jgi:fatty acid desaturase
MTLRHAFTGRVAQPWVPAPKRARIIAEARLLWALYAVILVLSLLLRSDALLLYWILPAIAGQPFLRLYLLAEHMGCAESADMFENTRTTYTNWAMRLLAWSMPYHVEHHAYPSVPFHKLAAVNRLVANRIKVSAPGYVAVHRGLLRDLGGRVAATVKASP